MELHRIYYEDPLKSMLKVPITNKTTSAQGIFCQTSIPLKEIFQITKGIFHQVCSTFEGAVELKKGRSFEGERPESLPSDNYTNLMKPTQLQ
jgi:hypothetical protein